MSQAKLVQISVARLSLQAAIDGGLTIATFVAGSLGALLLLDAHDMLGICSALVALALRIVHFRYAGYRTKPVRRELAADGRMPSSAIAADHREARPGPSGAIRLVDRDRG